MGKDKKQKKNQDKNLNDEPDAAESNLPHTFIEKDEKKSKKGKSELSASLSNDGALKASNENSDSDIEIVTLEQQGKTRGKEKKFKGGFDLLDVEGEDVDDLGDADDYSENKKEDNAKQDAKKSGKKSKKKDRKKKKEEDDEDLDKILEELTLEMTGGKPPEKPAKVVDVVTETKSEETAEKLENKKKKPESPPEEQELDSLNNEEGSTVKTAAQKKKEKKEREKLKKQQGKASKSEQVSTSKKKSDPEISKSTTSPEVEVEVFTEEIADVAEEDDASDKKKKKKKKATAAEEDDKKDKKRPGKKYIAAMQEALRKVKEEEEKFRLEEEARIAAAEEADRIKEEKLRIEQEKKDRKKQKEKEKRERLKAEGKLLSKSQRQNRARMEATLEALRQQGVEVPQVGEKKEKTRLGDRKKFTKKRPSLTETEASAPKTEPEQEIKETDELPTEVQVVEEEPEEKIKDAWYDTSEEEDEAPLKAELDAEKTTDDASKGRKVVSHSEDSSDGDDSSEDEDESESSSSSESEDDTTTPAEAVKLRIKRRREVAEEKRSISKLRSPVVCVLGHVDTGKTKILDKIRNTNVQDGEFGGITQQIGATMVPDEAIKEQCKMVKNFIDTEVKLPGLLIIDTPGHESFSNLRSRGSSLCDIAILVVDITHGLEPQTIESINMLKQKKTPFVVALNKVDRMYEWKTVKNKDVQDLIKSQSKSTKQIFEDRVKEVILEFATQSLNAVLYYENKDPRSYVSMVPTSALTGDGMGNLMALVVELTQSMLAKRLSFSDDLQATVLEVKAIGGLGHTMDVILVNGRLREGDTIVFAGYDGAMTSQIRSLLMPQPLKELRVKTQFIEHKVIEGAQGIKIAGKDLEKAIAGLPLLVPCRQDEIPILKEEISAVFKETMNSIKVTNVGVYVQASTLGSLEALMEFLTVSKIPVSGVRIGPVTKKDVMKCSVMLEHGPMYAVILAFDVKIEKEAQELADSSSIKIFHANIIYHLFDMYTNFSTELKDKAKEQHKNEAIFPCKLRILPQFVFNSRDPIIVGVQVEAGCVKEGTPLCVPSKEFLEIGTVTTIESNHKALDCARKGQEICIKIEPHGGEAPKMFGRHFDHTDLLVSKISRNSIDMCKKYFRDDLQKTDWQLMLELKATFAIL